MSIKLSELKDWPYKEIIDKINHEKHCELPCDGCRREGIIAGIEQCDMTLSCDVETLLAIIKAEAYLFNKSNYYN